MSVITPFIQKLILTGKPLWTTGNIGKRKIGIKQVWSLLLHIDCRRPLPALHISYPKTRRYLPVLPETLVTILIKTKATAMICLRIFTDRCAAIFGKQPPPRISLSLSLGYFFCHLKRLIAQQLCPSFACHHVRR